LALSGNLAAILDAVLFGMKQAGMRAIGGKSILIRLKMCKQARRTRFSFLLR
jgi:hypothetical protein